MGRSENFTCSSDDGKIAILLTVVVTFASPVGSVHRESPSIIYHLRLHLIGTLPSAVLQDPFSSILPQGCSTGERCSCCMVKGSDGYAPGGMTQLQMERARHSTLDMLSLQPSMSTLLKLVLRTEHTMV